MSLIPVGVTDFEKIRRGGYHFVDKTMFIAEFMRSGAEVTLLPRPRRFGKTLNLSMLHRFLDIGQDNRVLFEGLAVGEHEDIMAHCGAWPTVFITFKDIKYGDFESCSEALGILISDLFLDHRELIECAMPEGLKARRVRELMDGEASPVVQQRSLLLLTELLHRVTGKKAVVLIDEYDMPIHAGHHHGYYGEIIAYMRNFLSGAFKDNPHLHKGALTGILRVAKESIFSGFNNPAVRTIIDEEYSQYFGFTEEEVVQTLETFSLSDRIDVVRDWYNGYRFGPHTLYNPWSIMKFVNDARFPGAEASAHWVNTSDNELIRTLITEHDAILDEHLEILLGGGTVRQEIETDIVFSRMGPEMVWSLLLFSGYLKSEKTSHEFGRIICELAIPNLEVRSFYDKTVRDWVRERTGPRRMEPLLEAILQEDMERFSACFGEVVKGVLSYYDTGGKEPEKVYHTFFLGMLVNLRSTYRVSSNRESGFGRYDISLIPLDQTRAAYIFEIKTADARGGEKEAEEALQQISEKDYASAAREMGAARIHVVGIAIDGKRAHIAAKLIESNPRAGF